MRALFKQLYYFFPLNLVVLHLKKNQVLLFFWLFFFAAISGQIGTSLGLHYLFLDPEYLGSVNFLSLFLMGISIGIFALSFFITCYILDGHKYRFIAMKSHPFVTYSLNNSTLPALFLVYYIYKLFLFQSSLGLESNFFITLQALGLLLGYSMVIVLVFVYFTKTNRSAESNIAINIDNKLKQSVKNSTFVSRKILSSRSAQFKIKTYLKNPFKIATVNKNIIANKEIISKVFDQNHLNAVFVEFIIFVIIMSLGFYKDFDVFRIPAGASAFLFFSFLMMFTGALFYWLRAWAMSIVIITLLSVNFMMKEGYIKSKYEAFGLNYNTEHIAYSKDKINELNSESNYLKDRENNIQILNNWRNKFGEQNPKMVLIATSGGGQRSAMWTTCVLQALDKKLDKKLLNHTTLLTGASGGLIGSGFYRELYLRDLAGELDLLDDQHLDNISKDVLNPMVFSMLVSDLFLRYQKFEYREKTYYKGRGFAFENTLNKNIGGILGKSLSDYEQDEFSGKVPMLILAPTITNDAKKLFISTQKVSYLSTGLSTNEYSFRNRGIDYLTLFDNNDPGDLRFLSALRMSATFPYITPNIHLPTTPYLEIMDAGLSDNFGISDALKYIHVFKDWIGKNTSGVILISIRDKEKNPEIEAKTSQSIFDKTLNPIGALYKNWDFIQDNNNDQAFEMLIDDYGVPIDQISFEYNPLFSEGTKASLSWHLTSKEKVSIKNNINNKSNQAAIHDVISLLKP